MIAFVYLALPHSPETNANLTNAQWHLALLSFLIIVAAPSEKTLWKTFDFIIVLISALSGPFCLLLVPIALLKWTKTRDRRAIVLTLVLTFGSAVQLCSLLTTARPSSQPLGATVDLFFKIVGGHWFLSAIVGEKIHHRMIDRSLWNEGVAVAVSLLGFGLMIYAFIRSNLELRLLIVFSSMICCAALASPAISSDAPQWTVMWTAGIGSRYWLIPIFSYFIVLFYLAVSAEFRFLRYVSSALLVLSLVGIAADWKYPRFKDLEFQKYAAAFENAPAGEEISVPINPEPWEMRLVKK